MKKLEKLEEVGGESREDRIIGKLGESWVKLEIGEDRKGYDEKMKEVEKNKKKYFGDWLF